MEARRSGTPIRPAIAKRLENAKTPIDSLFPIRDRIRELHPDLTAINIFSEPTPAAKIQTNGVVQEAMIFALARRVSPRDENDDAKVNARGGRRLSGPTNSINMFFGDDSDEIFCKIDRFDYARLGPKLLDQCKTGKSLYAIKGTVPRDFRMIKVQQMRYLGEME